MKTLYLIRHAKSDWPENTDDFNRPLAERGRKDAQQMAEYLSGKNMPIDLLLVSSARRTLETASYFSRKFPDAAVQTELQLYHAAPDDFVEVLEQLPETVQSVAVFSHNNGISYFANGLSDENIQQMPTCAVAVFTVDTSSWKDFERSQKTFKACYTPKTI